MVASIPLLGPASVAGDVTFNGFKVTNLGTPSASTDAATKGYVDGKGPGIITGTGTAGRPVAPLAGQGYWRLDKNFLEVYDGTNWRVQGTVVVSSTADITNPVTGQQVIHAGDEYRRWQYTGSGWVVINSQTMTGQAIGGEWLNTSGTGQSLPNGGPTRLLFPTLAVGSGNGITQSNGGGDFTNEFEGLYFIDVQFRLATTIAGGVSMGLIPSSGGYSDSTLLMASHHPVQTSWGDQGLTGPIWLTAGTAWSFYFYNNSGTTVSISTLRAPRCRIWGMFAG